MGKGGEEEGEEEEEEEKDSETVPGPCFGNNYQTVYIP